MKVLLMKKRQKKSPLKKRAKQQVEGSNKGTSST
tara:strand:+ start:231 stop:332 length:102 start_codon:yes stop_codon:yes gene_type:complete